MELVGSEWQLQVSLHVIQCRGIQLYRCKMRMGFPFVRLRSEAEGMPINGRRGPSAVRTTSAAEVPVTGTLSQNKRLLKILIPYNFNMFSLIQLFYIFIFNLVNHNPLLNLCFILYIYFCFVFTICCLYTFFMLSSAQKI